MEGVDNHRVLVLNRVWQAVNIVGAKRAFSLLLQGHAQAVFSDEGQFEMMGGEEWIAFSLKNPPKTGQPIMRTVRLTLRVPSVLILRDYDRLPAQEVKFHRRAIFERDGYQCQYCGVQGREEELNLDHVIPRDYGGRTSWENIVTSCISCNSRKANRLPHEAKMKLIRKPERPRWRPFVSTLKPHQIEDAWRPFLTKGA
ncbi:MAG: HNH endonuclease [Opitutales bacterium]|nr:HNH endonuclease [Opitutales bacterium]NRA26751.1 HNH endonuclease [Opitutales bacterium]